MEEQIEEDQYEVKGIINQDVKAQGPLIHSSVIECAIALSKLDNSVVVVIKVDSKNLSKRINKIQFIGPFM